MGSRFIRIVVACVAVLLLAVGCDSSEPAAPGRPGGEPPLPALLGGVLRLRITGLPRDARPTVTVSGANYVTHVGVDADLEVPAGDYEITAGAFGGDAAGPFYAPKIASLNVWVPSTTGVSAEIVYQPLEIKLAPEVRAVTSETAETLSTVTVNADGTKTLSFTQANAESSSWKVNDILLFKKAKATPQGLSGRVVSTDGVTVVTKPVSLSEVYVSGGFHFEKQLSLDDVPLFTPGQAVTANYGLCPTLNAPLRLEQGGVTSTLDLQGRVCLHPTVTFDFWISSDRSAHSYFRVAGVFSSKLVAEAVGAASGALELSIGRFTFPPIDAGPFVVVPELDFRVFASARAEAGIYTGVEGTFGFDTGFGYDSNKSPDLRTWRGRSSSYTPVWPTPYVGAETTLEAGPQVNLLVDGVAGPYLGVRGLISYDVVVGRDPLWTLKAGLRVDTGIATASFIDKTFRIPIWEDLTTLATATSTPPVGVTTARAEGAAGKDIAVGPDDTLYFASANMVKAKKKNGFEVWSFTADAAVIHVAVAADGTVFATDFNANIYAIEKDSKLKWKKPAPLARGLAIGANHVYTTTFGASGMLEGFAILDGTAWSAPIGADHRGVAVAKDGTIYAAGGELHAIDPVTHAAKWTGTFGGSKVAPAIDDEGVVYTVDQNGAPRATNADGTNKWIGEARSSNAYYGISVGPDGTVYVCAEEGLGDGGLRAYAGDKGATKFIVRPPPTGALCRNAPTIGADGRIYLPTSYDLTVFEPNGSLAWQAPIPPGADGAAAFLSTKEVVVASSTEVTTFYAGTLLPTSNWPRAGRDNAGTGRKQ